MKKYLIVILFFCYGINYTYSQRVTIKNIESRLVTHQGVEFIGELKDKNNDLYKFQNWKNLGHIHQDGKIYMLSNLNFNIVNNSFVSRIDRNKMFVFKNSLIDSVVINNHTFKNMNNYFYEVLSEKGSYMFLKKYDFNYQEGKVSRMGGSVGQPKTLLVLNYLVKSEDGFSKIELNKKSVLDFFESNKEKLTNFVKKERLSYKKEDDVKKIFEYMLINSTSNI